MDFPQLSTPERLDLLTPPDGPVRMVLDTDTYNEIDDQFALVHAMLSPDRLNVEAIYAAPFHNARSSGPSDGMEKSYEEILRLLERLGVSPEGLAFRGSTAYLAGPDAPQKSEAALDLVERATGGGGGPLYVVAIGAITNVASAILLEPEIIGRIVVVWLGGHPTHCPSTREFNLKQDLHASRLIFDCGVPFVQIPCRYVASHLTTTVPEIDAHVAGRGALGDFLAERFKGYSKDHYAWAKEIWDISAIGYVVNPTWVPTDLVHSPILTDQVTWSVDRSRHWIRIANGLNRNAIFRDLFQKIEAHADRS